MRAEEYILSLPLSGVGDDLQSCMDWADGDSVAGLLLYADGLREAYSSTMALVAVIQTTEADVTFFGDRHNACFSGDGDVFDHLMDMGILMPLHDAEPDYEPDWWAYYYNESTESI